MKKLLVSFLLMLTCLSSWAASFKGFWDAPDEHKYPNYTPLFVKVHVNGFTGRSLGIAAFVEGDESVRACNNAVANDNTVMLLVRGDEAKDKGKKITFQVCVSQFRYTVTRTETMDFEASGHDNPINLTIDAYQGIEFTNPINIESAKNSQVDLSPYIKFIWGDGTVKTDYPSKTTSNSTLITTLRETWTNVSNSPKFSLSGSNLTVLGEGSNLAVRLSLADADFQYPGTTGYRESFNTVVNLSFPVIPVTDMNVSAATVNAEIGSDLNSIINSSLTVTMLPNDASNKEWSIDYSEASPGIDPSGIVMEGGDWTVYIVSVSNPEIKKAVTVRVPRPVSFVAPNKIVLSKTGSTKLQLTGLTGDNFDPSLVSVECEGYAMNGDTPFTIEKASVDAMTWNLTGKYVGAYAANVSYNGIPMTTESGSTSVSVEIPYEFTLPTNGWAWISLCYDAYRDGAASPIALKDGSGYIKALNRDANNRVIEIRTQSSLLYNDPKSGFFGDITELSSDNMYMIKAAYRNAEKFNLGCDVTTSYMMPTVYKGYTWIANPNEFDLTLDEINMLDFGPMSDGDKLIGKDGFIEFDETEYRWVGDAGFKLKAGQGYMYYSTGSYEKTVNLAFSSIPSCYMSRVRNRVRAEVHDEWEYDNSQFADNMAIVAQLNGVDEPENYTIGAFVGDECRGMGTHVKDGKMFINVAGKAGEKVTFCLYDKTTGEYSDITESVSYSRMRGSLSDPVMLSGDEMVTGISSAKDGSVQKGAAYNIAGQRVNDKAKGIVIVDGKKIFK